MSLESFGIPIKSAQTIWGLKETMSSSSMLTALAETVVGIKSNMAIVRPFIWPPSREPLSSKSPSLFPALELGYLCQRSSGIFLLRIPAGVTVDQGCWEWRSPGYRRRRCGEVQDGRPHWDPQVVRPGSDIGRWPLWHRRRKSTEAARCSGSWGSALICCQRGLAGRLVPVHCCEQRPRQSQHRASKAAVNIVTSVRRSPIVVRSAVTATANDCCSRLRAWSSCSPF